MGTIYKVLGGAYLLLALYLLNAAFSAITMPGFILAIEMWIYLIAAVLLGLAGVKNFLKRSTSIIPGLG